MEIALLLLPDEIGGFESIFEGHLLCRIVAQ
jgi:hypothetical protein